MREAGIAEKMAGGSPERKKPDAERGERREIIRARIACAPDREREATMKISGRSAPVSFASTSAVAGRGRRGVAIRQEQQQSEHGEQHGRHVELRHHGLRVEQRIEQQEQSRENRGARVRESSRPSRNSAMTTRGRASASMANRVAAME